MYCSDSLESGWNNAFSRIANVDLGNSIRPHIWPVKSREKLEVMSDATIVVRSGAEERSQPVVLNVNLGIDHRNKSDLQIVLTGKVDNTTVATDVEIRSHKKRRQFEPRRSRSSLRSAAARE